MDNNLEKYHDQIDAYLREELSYEDKIRFEDSLNSNQDLKEELAIHKELFMQEDEMSWNSASFGTQSEDVKELVIYFRSNEAQKLKNTLKNASKNYQHSKRKINLKWMFPIIAAASLVLVLMIYNNNTRQSPEELYSMHSNWEDLPSLTSRGENTESKLSKGQSLFLNKKYKLSYTFFKQTISDTKASSSVLIYLGLSSLELNKYKEAELYFDQLINLDSIDQSKGYWYKALLYLKQGQIKEVKLVLEQLLTDEGNYKYTEATELLNQLN